MPSKDRPFPHQNTQSRQPGTPAPLSDTQTPDDTDLRADDLRAVLHGTGEHVPAEVVRAAKAAFTWRTVDEELASLQHDSVLDALAGSAPAVRSTAVRDASEMLVFEASELTVLVQVAGRALTGQVLPAGEVRVDLVAPDGVLASTRAGETGMFALDGLPTGAVRLRLSLPRATPVLTPWFRRPAA